MHLQDRWRKILDQLKPDKVTRVEELTAATAASQATIRRDLNELQQLGRLRRVRGGASPIDADISANKKTNKSSTLDGQSFFADSLILNHAAKQAIAAKALEFIETGKSIIIDGGSTAYMMATMLKDEPIQVLTNSIPIIQSLLVKQRIKLTLPGGELFREQGIILNPFADVIIDNFYASTYFLGAQAITKYGLMQTDGLLVQSERRLKDRAEQIVVLADSSKFSAQGSMTVCSLSEIAVLITDSGIDEASKEMILNAGIKIIIV